MNGQELFTKLSQMTEDERKVCQFWQLTDSDYFDSCVEIVKDATCTEADGSEEEFDEVVEEMTPDEKAEIARCAQSIEGEMEEGYWNGFDDTFRQLLKERIEAKLGKPVTIAR